MRFHENAGVFTASGDKVGNLARVVMTPRTKTISHIVVRQGFLFTEDKVLPVDLIDTATEERVVLRAGVKDLDHLPRYEDEHYIPLHETDAPEHVQTGGAIHLYPYAPVGTGAAYPLFWNDTDPRFVTETVENIPDGAVALNTGASVIAADDKNVGSVERIIMDTDNQRASHFVIAQGMFFKDRKLVPTAWIDFVGQDEVHLLVTASFLERLPAYDQEFA